MNIAAINDCVEKDVLEFIEVGQKIGKNIALITPQNFIKSLIKQASLIIIFKIKQYPYHQLEELFFEITERCCPYVNIEKNYEKANHAFIGWSFYNRAMVNIFINDEMCKFFLRRRAYGIVEPDIYHMWHIINKKIKEDR